MVSKNKKSTALVVIDIQNDITKNYKDIIDNINKAIECAKKKGFHVVYIRQEYLSEGMRKFKPGTHGAELVDELKIVSNNIFTKNKGSVLSSVEFENFVEKEKIDTFYLTGADAIACVKTSNNQLLKAGHDVSVLSDCITSYDKKKIPEALAYYKSKGSKIITLKDLC